MTWKRVGPVAEFPADGLREVETEDGTNVLVLASGGSYHACQVMCPHMDTPLVEGMFDGETLTCHQHLWQWDIETGDPKGLSEMPLERYDVKDENGTLFVDLP